MSFQNDNNEMNKWIEKKIIIEENTNTNLLTTHHIVEESLCENYSKSKHEQEKSAIEIK